MKKIVLVCVFLIGYVPADSKSCESRGKWSFDRFEYAGYITADRKYVAQNLYENTSFEINSSNVTIGGFDIDKNA